MEAKLARAAWFISALTPPTPPSSSWRVPKEQEVAAVRGFRSMLLSYRPGGKGDVRTTMGHFDDGVDLLCVSKSAQVGKKRSTRGRSVGVD